MDKLTKDQLSKLREEWFELRKKVNNNEKELSYNKTRYRMIEKAWKLTYGKYEKRMKEIREIFQDDIDKLISRRKYIFNEDNQLIFIGYENGG